MSFTQRFFKEGYLLKELNHMFIGLIPKFQGALEVGVSGFSYTQLKLGTEPRTGQTGSPLLGIKTRTTYFNSTILGTGIITTSFDSI